MTKHYQWYAKVSIGSKQVPDVKNKQGFCYFPKNEEEV